MNFNLIIEQMYSSITRTVMKLLFFAMASVSIIKRCLIGSEAAAGNGGGQRHLEWMGLQRVPLVAAAPHRPEQGVWLGVGAPVGWHYGFGA